jgi:hypothetical protein
MRNALPRLLLALSALILALGGLMHSRAFDGAVTAVASSDLPAFYGRALQALWLIDSATLLTLAVVFAAVAVAPALASRPVVVLLALLPAATALLLYRYLGSFLPAHLLIGAATAAAVGGLLLPSRAEGRTPGRM